MVLPLRRPEPLVVDPLEQREASTVESVLPEDLRLLYRLLRGNPHLQCPSFVSSGWQCTDKLPCMQAIAEAT